MNGIVDQNAIETCVCAAVLGGRRNIIAPVDDVFKAWILTAPKDGMGYIGYALVLAGRGETDKARKILESVSPNMARAELAAEIASDIFDETDTHKGTKIERAELRGPANLKGGIR